ncbi:ABC transporter substrate-binding protein [Haloplanus halophilus]|uniref:ABC transporter substrate-binding protein n=1 Tax=Haloplanus halophilus TaxID=2949993 RepID=UPI002042596B|nr:ABC transporter substrate-binding protein [Haloplanus sp. GDY1]
MSDHSRRDVLRGLGATGTAGIVSLAGCSQQEGDGGGSTPTATEMDGGGDDGGDGGDGGDTATETEGDMGGGEPIALGSIFPITGTNSAYGGGHQQAFNLAVEEINDSGGVLGGREITPINRDTEGSPSRSAQKFRTMINQEGIVGLVGPYSSGIGTTLAPIARDNRVMEVSNGNTSPALATAGVNESNGVKYYGRTSPNDVQQALVMARVLNQSIEAESASFLYVDNPYGQGLAEAASQNFEGETLNMVAYSQATSDYTSTLDSVFEGDPDAVGAVMYPGNGRTILQQWNQGGYGGQWVGAEAILSPQLLSDLSEIVEGMYITSPQTANSETFQENMGGQGNITQFAPHAYDATYLMGFAMEKAGEASGTGIARNIRSVSRPNDGDTTVSVAEFGAGKEAIGAGDPINYDGASGSVDLNENLEPVVPYRILQVQSGEAQVVEEVPLSYFEGKI